MGVSANSLRIDLVVVTCSRSAGVVPAAPRPAVGLIVGGTLGAPLFIDQCLPIGNGNLVVIRVDFAEGKEAVAVAAIIDEGGLQ